MQAITNASAVNILRNTLNFVDARLTDHGMRVSYMVFRMLRRHGRYSAGELRDMALLAMLHDIGAYKTEEIDEMMRFETEDVWDHAIWGYLFLTYFSPLSALAPAILYHHAAPAAMPELSPLHRDLAQFINIADRADVFDQQLPDGRARFLAHTHAGRDTRYRGDVIDLFYTANPRSPTVGEIAADTEYWRVMHDTHYSAEALDAYLRLDVLSIDFRSPNTATHTITTSVCSRELAAYMSLPPEETSMISTGAMIHDLGKTGIPVEILEFPGKLSPKAMDIMKRHVDMTEQILRDNIDDALLHIAIRHHEKLDGSGYPRGLRGNALTLPDRIVAVSDIVSALYEVRSYKQPYPKGRILGIIGAMAGQGLIDRKVVRVITAHFDEISAKIDAVRDPILEQYELLQQSFIALQSRLNPQ